MEEADMSMFMASMRQAARDGELEGMGLFGAALKAEVAEYERKLLEEEERRRILATPTQDKAE